LVKALDQSGIIPIDAKVLGVMQQPEVVFVERIGEMILNCEALLEKTERLNKNYYHGIILS